MKLFRIETNDASGIFDTTFQEDIIIKPNSQVALNQASFEVNFEELIVDASNSEFEYKVNNVDVWMKGNFDHGKVDKSTYSGYLISMQKQLNSLLDIEVARNLGMQWKVLLDTNNRINMGYKISPIGNYSDEFKLRGTANAMAAYDATTKTFYATNARAVLSQYAISPYTLCNGGGQFRAQIKYFGDNTLGKVYNGLFIAVLNKFIPDGETLLLSNIKIGIGIDFIGTNGGFYYYYKDGVKNYSTTAPIIFGNNNNRNPYLTIDITDGKLSANVYTDDDGVYEIADLPYDQNSELYPAIIFHGGRVDAPGPPPTSTDYATVHNVTLTKNPWKHDAETSILPHDPLQVVPLPSSSIVPANNEIKFSSSIATFFGYADTHYGVIIASEISYIADNDFYKHNSNDMYIIELLNISVDSYDSYTQGRKNYLGMVPSGNRYHITYNANFPIWLGMNNEKELTIRNIKCRIINADRSPVSCFGKANLVLLFDS